MTTRIWWALGVATVAGLAPVARADGDTPPAEGKAAPDVEARLVAFGESEKAAEKAKDWTALITAIGTLAEVAHKDVVKPIARHTGHAEERVAVAAVAGLGRVGQGLALDDKGDVTKALLPALKFFARRPGVALEAIRALGACGDLRAVPALVPLIESKENELAKAAIQAFASLRHVAAIDPCLDELTKMESGPRGRGDGGASGASTSGGWGQGGTSEKLAARIQALKEPIQKTLTAITGKSFQTALEWKRWWKSAKATWKVRVPETPTPEPRPG